MGWSSAAQMRRAAATAMSAPATSSSSTTNSSPPKRASRSLLRTTLLMQAHRPFRTRDRDSHEYHRQAEGGEQDQPARRAGRALAREEQREQDDRAEFGDRGGRDDELTQARVDVAGVLQHREDHAERGRDEHDRD